MSGGQEASPSKKPQVQQVQAQGGNEEKCREINQERGGSEIVKLKINAEKHRPIPNVGRAMQMIM